MKREWSVRISERLLIALTNPKEFLLPRAKLNLLALLRDLRFGPSPTGWKNLGLIKGQGYWHCHIKSGRPTYVACWKAILKTKIIEVFCVGTHEDAPCQK